MLIFLICFRVWTLLGHVCDTGSTLVCGSPPIFSWYCPKKTTKAKKQKVNQRTDEKGCITWEVLIGTAWGQDAKLLIFQDPPVVAGMLAGGFAEGRGRSLWLFSQSWKGGCRVASADVVWDPSFSHAS